VGVESPSVAAPRTVTEIDRKVVFVFIVRRFAFKDTRNRLGAGDSDRVAAEPRQLRTGLKNVLY